jgi:hypothetical protein
MRINVKNVIATALLRGIATGYIKSHRTTPTDKELERVVNTISECVWESLDELIDFSHEDDEKKSGRIGFDSADAVSDTELTEDDEPDTLEDL